FLVFRVQEEQTGSSGLDRLSPLVLEFPPLVPAVPPCERPALTVASLARVDCALGWVAGENWVRSFRQGTMPFASSSFAALTCVEPRLALLEHVSTSMTGSASSVACVAARGAGCGCDPDCIGATCSRASVWP